MTPWAKTGGLADVVGALPAALSEAGHTVTVVIPRYRGIVADAASATTHVVRLGSASYTVTFRVVVVSAGVRVVLVDVPELFDREGLYGGATGRDYADNDRRFGLLATAALDFGERDARPVDVVHAHDWQAGLVPALIRTDPARWPRLAKAGLVFTIHNLAYQGLFPRETVPALGLPWSVFRLDTGEFWNQLSFLKCGLTYCDYLTTVSPAYARETQTTAFGCGMEGVLQAREERYVGILNGIDTEAWDPKTDPNLPAHFDASDLGGKVECKRALLAHFGLPQGDDALTRPLVGMVSRLVEQKGVDLVAAAGPELTALDATWVFVGRGDAKYEAFLREWSREHPSRVAAHIGFEERLAHLVEAGSDLFLMPSKFEPCGLNQMYSLRYGTVPVVHGVGGLDDTIQPYTARARWANGFKFRPASVEAMTRALRQALRLYHDEAAWRPLMLRGMQEDHSWQTSAKEYVKVYRRARDEAAG